jgi:hypothetical protein
MKLLLLIVALAVGLSAADNKKPFLVTFDASTMTLSWVSTKDGKTKHSVDFRTRLMDRDGKGKKRFTAQEQAQMVQYFTLLMSYVVESEDWYERPETGSGEPQPQGIRLRASR